MTSVIETLTLAQLRQAHAAVEAFSAKASGAAPGAPSSGEQHMAHAVNTLIVGTYCIARCYAAGVHAGVVVAVDDDKAVLANSRRLWGWKAADGVALSGLAQNGLATSGSKIDTMNPKIYLTGVAELIPCAPGVMESINAAK
jgi:hypothetical protein